MAWLLPALLAAALASLLASGVYFYLFGRERSQALLVWGASWSLYTLRFLLQAGMIIGHLPGWFIIPQQAVSVASGLLFLWGAHLFTGRRFSSVWLASGAAVALWVPVGHLRSVSFLAANLPVDLFMGSAYVWSGVIVNRYLSDHQVAGRFAGWFMILWGLHKANYAFLRPVVWFAPIGFTLASVLFLGAAISIVLVYYELNRKELQKEIARVKANEDRFRSLVDSSTDAIFIADAEGRILLANAGACAMFGYEAAELAGQQLEILMPERFRGRHLAGTKRIVVGGPSSYLGRNLQFSGLHKTGREFPISLNVAAWQSDGAIFFSGILRDMTDLMRMQEEVSNQHALLSSLIDSIPDCIFYKDRESVYLGGNRQFALFVGRRKEELAGSSDFDFFPQERAEAYREEDRQVLATRQPRRSEEKVTYPDGRKALLDVLKTPFYDAEGHVLGLIGVSRDITERQRAALALQEKERLLTNVFDSIQDGITVLDANLNIVRTNAVARKIFAHSMPLVGKKCYQAFHQRATPCVVCPSQRTLASGRLEREEIGVQDAAGKERFFEVVAFPLFDEKGAVVGVVENGRDITARKKAEAEREELAAELRQARKMEAIGTLAGGIAHDFNNILGIILGYSDLSRGELPEGHPAHEMLNEVISAGLRAKELVRQILTFSRQREQKREPLQVSSIIKEGVRFLRASIPSSISITTEIDNDCGMILADPTQIHQVLLNLCTNAAQAMENGGVLDVSLKAVTITAQQAEVEDVPAAGDYVALAVRDTGSGIDPEIRERIFDPYFTTKEVGKGSGMGLAVVYGIVRNHAAYIAVESELGKGSQFIVYFPVVKGAVEEVAAAAGGALPHGTGRVLFVDDEAGLREIGEKMLTRLGYTVTAKDSAIGALEIFRQDPDKFDLVITDQTMPMMSGMELAGKIMAIRPGMPIVLCTGYSGAVTEEAAIKAGLAGFAMKPLAGRELAELVARVLRQAREGGQAS